MRRVGTALATVAVAVLAWASPAAADVEGFDARVDQAPGTLTIGKAARSLTAVVSTDRDGRCRKVRWSLVMRTEGVSLDQLRVLRVENGRSFRVRAQLQGDAARLVDAQPDPGELCRDRTVTGRWDIASAGPDDGTVTLEAQALDGAGRVLASTSTTSRVVSPVAATKKPSPSPSVTKESPEVEEEAAEEEPVADEPAGDEPSEEAAAINRTAATPSLLGPGLIVGAVLVFLGVGLLMRMRMRNRRAAAEARTLPTGFYSMPRKRSS